MSAAAAAAAAGRAMVGRAARGLVLALLAAAASLPAGGCDVAGAVLYKTVGPMPVDAEYVPEKKPMLVFVERYNTGAGGGGIDAAQEAEGLAVAIREALEAKQIAPQVDPMSVSDLRVRDPMGFRTMTVSKIGQEVGAEQVLYVNLLQSTLKTTEGSDLSKGQMAVRVKVVDASTGQVLWPVDAADGRPVTIQTPVASAREGISPTVARANMTRQMADSVAKLFYRHQPIYDPVPE